MKWSRRHVLDTDDWSRDEIEAVLDQTRAMVEILARPIRRAPPLRGRTVILFFAEASTRTRVSFELAAKALSADVTNITASGSSVEKGESLYDTVRTLQALGVVVGDVLHSRVARSDINTLMPLGARVTLSGPPTLIPMAWRCGTEGLPPGVTYESDLDKALDGADAVIALRLQRERQASGLLPSLREYSRVWGLSADRVARMRSGAPVLHPGPMNEGVEIDAAVAHGSRSLIEKQVTNGVAVRMALLYLLAATAPLEERA